MRFELCGAKSGYIYNLEINTGAQPTNLEHNMVFSVVDRLCDKVKGKGHCIHGQMVLQSKDLQPFMGLQNKDCRHSDVKQKKKKKRLNKQFLENWN